MLRLIRTRESAGRAAHVLTWQRRHRVVVCPGTLNMEVVVERYLGILSEASVTKGKEWNAAEEDQELDNAWNVEQRRIRTV